MRHPVIILHHAQIRTHGHASWRRSIWALALRSTAIWLLWIIHHVLRLVLVLVLAMVLKRLLVLVLVLVLMLMLMLVGSLRCRCRLWSRCNVRNVSDRGMLGLLELLGLLGLKLVLRLWWCLLWWCL
jgi:hypothetical protein